MTAKEQLYEKLSAEYAAFIDGLKSAPSDKIIDSAYEKVFKEDILSCFEYSRSYSEQQISALLALEYPLDELYRNWLDTDVSYMDDLSDTISSFATREVREQNGIVGEGIAEAVEISNYAPQTAEVINGSLNLGDWVIAAPSDEYGYLLGVVTAIDKLGTPEHDTENSGDDIHVDFTAFDYPPERISEIEEAFSDSYGEPKDFDELPLDDVIMAPDTLIRITELGHDEITRLGNLLQNCVAFCKCFPGTVEPQGDLHAELMERLDKNLADYHNSLTGFGTRELIDMVGKIAAMKDVHDYMTTTRGFDDDELQFYLQFQNPLEVVADAWLQRNADNEDLSFTLDFVFDKKDALFDYPLMSDSEAPADFGLHRFMGVDLIDFLGKISEKVIIHYPNDWSIDADALRRYAMIDDFSERRLMWHVCSVGTHLKPERNVFIRESGEYEYMTDYHQNDPDMFGYYIEVTGKDGQRITGNVFEVGNYADLARHIHLTALPLDSVTLTYSNDWGVNAGKTITVSRREYDDDRKRLMSESGNVIDFLPHPKNEQELQKVLRDERTYRMSFPIGSMEEHLSKLAEKIAAIREPQQPEIPPADKKLSIGDRLAAGNEKVRAYKEQKAQNPENTTPKHKKEDVLE